jgi:hypothetical protein
MNPLLDLLGDSLDQRALGNLSAQIGASPQQTGRAVEAALPLLLGALQRNAASPDGAAALGGALRRDHDGSVLDDVAGFFGEPPTGRDVRSLDHIFGGRRAPVENAVSRASGLDGSQVMQLLAQLAPLILGALARARGSSGSNGTRRAGRSSGGLGLEDLLGGAVGQMQGKNPGLGGLLGSLLDSDGDGSIVDDLLEKGLGGGGGAKGGGLGGLLGGLLGGGRR